MAYAKDYLPIEPSRDDIERIGGAVLLEFGSLGCGLCRFAAPAIERALATRPGVRHVKIEDGSGRPLGRAYGIRQWPTLVFLRDGVEVSRLVRPAGGGPIEQELRRLDAPGAAA